MANLNDLRKRFAIGATPPVPPTVPAPKVPAPKPPSPTVPAPRSSPAIDLSAALWNKGKLKAFKGWKCSVESDGTDACVLVLSWGAIDFPGQAHAHEMTHGTRSTFISREMAIRHAKKLIQAKIKDGYTPLHIPKELT